MNTLLSKLAGYKTYGTAVLGIFYLIGAHFAWWKLEPSVLATFGFGGLAFLRAGVKNELGSLVEALLPGLQNLNATPGTAPSTATANSGPGGAVKAIATLLLVCGLGGAAMVACAPLQPGADPLVVRAQQTLTTGKQTFDLVLNLDNSDRGMWRTNAPAFHNFCEWLRTPQVVDQTNSLPRGASILWNLNETLVSYQTLGGSTNALWSALSALNTTLGQATSWINIVTNTPHL